MVKRHDLYRRWDREDYINDILEVFDDEETWSENTYHAKKERDAIKTGLNKLDKLELVVLWHQIINCPGIKESKRDELIKSWIAEKERR